MQRAARVWLTCLLLVGFAGKAEAFGKLGRAVQSVGGAIGNGLQSIVEGTGAVLNGGLDAVKDGAAAVADVVTDIAGAVGNAPGNVVKTVTKAAEDLFRETGVAWENVTEAVGRAGTDSWRESRVAITNAGVALEKSFQDTGKAAEKAGQDTWGELGRVPGHVEDTLKALYNFNVGFVEGVAQNLSEAEVRIRSGKFVDAVWHLSFTVLTSSEEAAAEAALDSTYLRTIGTLAASTYGGPQGAAAYAAWLTYRQSGDLSLAVRTGVISGVSSAAFAAADSIPRDSAYDKLKRTIVTAAIGGAGVAAAGGDEEAILNGMLMSGAMVVVKDAYADYMSRGDAGPINLDPTDSDNVPAYCFRGEVPSLPGTACTPLPAKYQEKLPDGSYKIKVIDPRDLDPKVPQVGLKDVVLTKDATGLDPALNVAKVQFSEQGFVMEALSKVPGVQAGALLHDTWHMSWAPQIVLQTTFIPAFAISYYGTVAPIQENIRETALERAIRTREVFTEKDMRIPLEPTVRTQETQAAILGLAPEQGQSSSASAQAPTSSEGALVGQLPQGYAARRKQHNYSTGLGFYGQLAAWGAIFAATSSPPGKKRIKRRRRLTVK
ncbi:hypothetical protein [Deinococcus humi]|uniref:Uncharacterized protein n=1 Tax=Deinococcus humi TaxID=662880 RepID=A0A7W8K023_9DEIO|nr:hypothetical protein [Deinococcus humi]MBB5366160.1 hypothetical protein [Deinococcus humi]GGO40651.1 hypothetical protein GCM10008949_50410 [Deinococcus humi]